MEIKYIIAISIFILVIFIYRRLAKYYFRNEVYGEKYLKSWSGKTYFWQSAVFVSSGVTFLIILFLKWSNILTV